MTAISIALIAWAAALAALDIRSQRVPNFALVSVILVTAVCILLYSTGPLGVDGFTGLIGAAVPLVLLPSYASGWLGAGDIKLASTMGLLLGPAPLALVLLFAGLLIGGAACHSIAAQRRTRRLPAAPMLAAGFVAVVSLAAFA